MICPVFIKSILLHYQRVKIILLILHLDFTSEHAIRFEHRSRAHKFLNKMYLDQVK